MAKFTNAFTISKANEGGYVNDPDDMGGETYRGIARRYNPQWAGFAVIDKMKAVAPIKYNYTDATLDELAGQFYKPQFWDKFKGDAVASQDIANQIYDHTLSGLGRAISMAKAVLNKKFGYNLGEGSTMDSATVEAINKVDQAKFFNEYKQARADFFKYSAANLAPADSVYFDLFKKYNSKPNAKNIKYLNGWLNRVNKYVYTGFEEVVQAAKSGAEYVKKKPLQTILVTVAVVISAYTLYTQLKRKN